MKIKIGFFAIALTFALIITHSFEALACFLSAFIHELGHIAAARISNKIQRNEVIAVRGISRAKYKSWLFLE